MTNEFTQTLADILADTFRPADELSLPERLTVEDFATAEAAHDTCYFYGRNHGFGPFQEWEIDHARVDAAAELLGITWELEVRHGKYRELGPASLAAYMADRRHPFGGFVPCHDQHHQILVRPHEVGPIMASCSLWHELAHAKQAEQYESPTAFYRAVNDAGGYREAQKVLERDFHGDPGMEEARALYLHNPFEYEAFQHNRYHFDHFPLVNPV